MSDFYRLLSTYEALIYIVLATVGLVVARWAWRSWREWSQAAFRLEREFSIRRLSQASALLVLVLLLLCGEFVMASFVIPALPADFFLATPTLDLLAAPEGTSVVVGPAAGPPPAETPAGSSGCVPGSVSLSSPESGAEVSGVIELQGTVDIPNFGFYKYEVSVQGSNTWATISAGRTVVKNGTLGRWDTTALTPGNYQLRLVATDNQGESLPACVVAVRVLARE